MTVKGQDDRATEAAIKAGYEVRGGGAAIFAEGWRAALVEAEAREAVLVEALRELVRLKDLKNAGADWLGTEKEAACRAARSALAEAGSAGEAA